MATVHSTQLRQHTQYECISLHKIQLSRTQKSTYHFTDHKAATCKLEMQPVSCLTFPNQHLKQHKLKLW